MRPHIILPITLLIGLPSIGQSAAVLIPVTVNTSSISGTIGSIDLQFNPGPLVTQSASLMILSFASNGTLDGGPVPTGDVSGTLPSTLAFSNAAGFNDYFQEFTFSSRLSFTVALSGPAVFFPDGTSTSGSEFAFSMFSNAAGSIPTLTTDTIDGFAVTMDVGLDGTITTTNFSLQTTVGAQTIVPEPDSFVFLLIATPLIGLLRRNRFGARTEQGLKPLKNFQRKHR